MPHLESDTDFAQMPRLALRIGVSGHRHLSNVAQVTTSIRDVLTEIHRVACQLAAEAESGYAKESPVLRVVSPIAEGSDRIVASEGLALGYELQCPLPFDRQEYERDFEDEDSKKSFLELLSKATAVFELDGRAHQRDSAYQAVGRVVLAQSDLIIAIWDGEPARGIGGTAQIVSEAEQAEIPVVWIDPGSPGAIRLVRTNADLNQAGTADSGWQAGLAAAIRRLASKPSSAEAAGTTWIQRLSRLAKRFVLLEAGEDHLAGRGISPQEFVECMRRPSWPASTVLGRVWRVFSKTMAYSSGRKVPSAPKKPLEPVSAAFSHEYVRADQAANYFASLYRGSFVSNYVLGALAVVLALLPLVVERLHLFWTLAELLVIVGILSLIRQARLRRWHQKSVDLRYFAEQLRQMQFLWPLGRVTPSTRPPAHQAFGDPRNTCMNWWFLTLVRSRGLVSVRVTGTYRDACVKWVLADWVTGQLDYHESAVDRLHNMHHRLHTLARMLFFLTGVGCVAHLFVKDEFYGHCLTVLAASLPAAAAAAHGIASQGEFHRLSEQSKAMAEELRTARKEIETVMQRGSGSTLAEFVATILPVARGMMEEVRDWRILYHKPPIEPA